MSRGAGYRGIVPCALVISALVFWSRATDDFINWQVWNERISRRYLRLTDRDASQPRQNTWVRVTD